MFCIQLVDQAAEIGPRLPSCPSSATAITLVRGGPHRLAHLLTAMDQDYESVLFVARQAYVYRVSFSLSALSPVFGNRPADGDPHFVI